MRALWPRFPEKKTIIWLSDDVFTLWFWPLDLEPWTRGHFRSRDKDSGHTVRPAIVENPMLYAKFMALMLYRTAELLPIEVLHCGNRELRRYLLLWPWPWSDDLELDLYSLKMYRVCLCPTSMLSNVIIWQTDRHDRNYTPRRFA